MMLACLLCVPSGPVGMHTNVIASHVPLLVLYEDGVEREKERRLEVFFGTMGCHTIPYLPI